MKTLARWVCLGLLSAVLALFAGCERGVHLNPNEIIIQPDFSEGGSNYATDDWKTVYL